MLTLFAGLYKGHSVSQTGEQREEAEMWGGIIGLIIQLISGAVGGNIAGAAMKQYNLEQSATRLLV